MDTKKYTYSDIELVCKFMGWKIWKPWIAKFKPFDHTLVSTYDDNVEIELLEEDLKTDWNVLKIVMDKIGKLQFDNNKGVREYMSKNWGEHQINIYTPIDVVYKKVIRFLRWYYV